MTKKLVEITSDIVQSQVSSTPMSAIDIASSLRKVFSTLRELQTAETSGVDIEVLQPALEADPKQAIQKLSPANSIQNDKVICLECGAEMRQLSRTHLASHGMSPKEYKKKYGFSMKTPLSAKSVTKARSKAAKKRGLPENLQKFIEARRNAKAKAKTTPKLSGPGAERAKKVRHRFSPKKME